MATGFISILLPQHPTFQKVVTYFHKFRLNTMEHQGPISYPCIWFIWAAAKCHASTRSKPKRESWASREARVHRFKQGTNITSASRLWLLSPLLCRGKQDSMPKGEQPGRAEHRGDRALYRTLFAGADGRLKSMQWQQRAPSSRSPHFLSPTPFLSLFERLQTYFHGPFNQNWKLKASQREWTLHFAKDLILSCLKMKKNQILFPWWWLP